MKPSRNNPVACYLFVILIGAACVYAAFHVVALIVLGVDYLIHL